MPLCMEVGLDMKIAFGEDNSEFSVVNAYKFLTGDGSLKRDESWRNIWRM